MLFRSEGKVHGPYPTSLMAERMMRVHLVRLDLESDLVKAGIEASVGAKIVGRILHSDDELGEDYDEMA